MLERRRAFWGIRHGFYNEITFKVAMMRDISVTMIVGYQAVGPTENKWN